MQQRTSHPRRLLRLLLAAIFIGYCQGFNAPFQGATARRVRLQLRNDDGDETDDPTKTKTPAEEEESEDLYTWAELQADPEMREAGEFINQFCCY